MAVLMPPPYNGLLLWSSPYYCYAYICLIALPVQYSIGTVNPIIWYPFLAYG